MQMGSRLFNKLGLLVESIADCDCGLWTLILIVVFGVVDDALDISCRTDVVVELDGADC